MSVPVAVTIDRQRKVAWVGYPDVKDGHSFDQALGDTFAGKVDSQRAVALQGSAHLHH